MLFVREDIPAKLLSRDFPLAESFFVEINLYKKKWLINCSYNPHKNDLRKHFDTISKSLDTYSTKYENILILGDFNACVGEEPLDSFCKSYCFTSLIKQPTCFKNRENPSCIDLILTNKLRSFQTKCVIETGLSDFHRMTLSVLKMHFRKLPRKTIIEILKNLIMKGLCIPCIMLSVKNNLITAKILTSFMKFFIVFLMTLHQEKRSAFEEK